MRRSIPGRHRWRDAADQVCRPARAESSFEEIVSAILLRVSANLLSFHLLRGLRSALPPHEDRWEPHRKQVADTIPPDADLLRAPRVPPASIRPQRATRACALRLRRIPAPGDSVLRHRKRYPSNRKLPRPMYCERTPAREIASLPENAAGWHKVAR